ncbi:hypothetical protein DP939_06495 [Spongiactinospora rosea]|uniref:Uncharacterized protein n=1 Tax=Spongiactinospora rosea TaxID=2248750 RepID=A0A366M3F6_9ACTN|nr:hypothetical protein [Spongiactinospora rosea]RBQ20726.1 hypothetical protein DP939_06495 [Spongiactinospora rosea]
MKIRFLGKTTTGDQSPTLYDTDQDMYLVQGWIVSDQAVLDQLDLPAHETAVLVPKKLMSYLPKAAQNPDGEPTPHS